MAAYTRGAFGPGPIPGPIDAGRLDRQLTLFEPTETQDAAGQPIETWLLIETVWSSFEALTIREPFTAEQIAAFVDARFVIRFREDISPKWRVRLEDSGRVYEVVGVREIARREGLEILAQARGE